MKLTRRDAAIALGTAGIAASAGAAGVGLGLLGSDAEDATGNTSGNTEEDVSLSGHQRETLTAIAGELYPDEVEGVATFVDAYLDGRSQHSPDHAAAIGEATDAFDEYCQAEWDGTFLDLPAERRDGALTGMGLEVVDPRPDGRDAERVRYYVVDELLYALYASPTGGELLGIENPPGHAGGQTSYQRGPDA